LFSDGLANKVRNPWKSRDLSGLIQRGPSYSNRPHLSFKTIADFLMPGALLP
jgi:hypothetical protein